MAAKIELAVYGTMSPPVSMQLACTWEHMSLCRMQTLYALLLVPGQVHVVSHPELVKGSCLQFRGLPVSHMTGMRLLACAIVKNCFWFCLSQRTNGDVHE